MELKYVHGIPYGSAKVVMLPTNKKSVKQGQLVMGAGGNHLFTSRKTDDIVSLKAYHLYITSDEEIKEGDWHICNDIIKKCIFIGKANGTTYLVDELGNQDIIIYCKKIIATTDESLIYRKGFVHNSIDGFQDLPQLSQQFIENWIEEYNKNNQIVDILVECNGGTKKIKVPIGHDDYSTGLEYTPEKLKVNFDNTINIKPIKNSWNREEVNEEKSELIHLFFSSHYDKLSNIGFTSQYIRKWIEENL